MLVFIFAIVNSTTAAPTNGDKQTKVMMPHRLNPHLTHCLFFCNINDMLLLLKYCRPNKACASDYTILSRLSPSLFFSFSLVDLTS